MHWARGRRQNEKIKLTTTAMSGTFVIVSVWLALLAFPFPLPVPPPPPTPPPPHSKLLDCFELSMTSWLFCWERLKRMWTMQYAESTIIVSKIPRNIGDNWNEPLSTAKQTKWRGKKGRESLIASVRLRKKQENYYKAFQQWFPVSFSLLSPTLTLRLVRCHCHREVSMYVCVQTKSLRSPNTTFRWYLLTCSVLASIAQNKIV